MNELLEVGNRAGGTAVLYCPPIGTEHGAGGSGQYDLWYGRGWTVGSTVRL